MKEKTMKLVVSDEQETEQQTEAVLPDMALTIFKDGKTGKWAVAKIPCNGTQRIVGKLEVVEADEERVVSIERFKILAGEFLMG